MREFKNKGDGEMNNNIKVGGSIILKITNDRMNLEEELKAAFVYSVEKYLNPIGLTTLEINLERKERDLILKYKCRMDSLLKFGVHIDSEELYVNKISIEDYPHKIRALYAFWTDLTIMTFFKDELVITNYTL